MEACKAALGEADPHAQPAPERPKKGGGRATARA